MAAFEILKANGHTDQPIKVYMPLNAPGETVHTLGATIELINKLHGMFGRDRVLPFIFFIGIQPGTPVERLPIRQGYLKANYNPLTCNPFLTKRLLYNPPPLGRIIARAYLEAVATTDPDIEYVGRTTMDILARELARPEVVARVRDRAAPVLIAQDSRAPAAVSEWAEWVSMDRSGVRCQ